MKKWKMQCLKGISSVTFVLKLTKLKVVVLVTDICYRTTHFSPVHIVEINSDERMLLRNIKHKHQHGGRKAQVKDVNLPSVSHQDHIQRQSTISASNDHDYAMDLSTTHSSTSQQGQSPSSSVDHDYVRVPALPPSPRSPPSPPPTSPVQNMHREYAINNNIQDFTIDPNNHERHDMLTFSASVKQKIQQILISRLRNHAIKWYMSVQVELVKDGENGEDISNPYFRSRTYSLLNLDTMTEEDLTEAYQKLFASS